MNRTDQLNTTMELASQALASMDYLGCERHGLRALKDARAQSNWAYYSRILLPLQEARRQRRMVAAEGVVRLGSANLTGQPIEWITRMQSGCIVLTHPHTSDTARELVRSASEKNHYIEVLFADNSVSDTKWILRSLTGCHAAWPVPAPPPNWQDRWFEPGDAVKINSSMVDQKTSLATNDIQRLGPVDWFLHTYEAFGDAMLAQVEGRLGDLRRVIQIEQCLMAVTDHEILHQALGEAAKALHLAT